ncbi:hypothetical protein B0H10DRAFT_2039794 [Mycena sp. CBHHK59/15]|nr:hypothetical protein B0H10DRAFT_2039794 [Mycena sp. CBHHK59/15]
MDIDNEEISSMLPSKTVPTRSKSNKTQTRVKVATTSTGKRKQTSDSASAPANKKANHRATVEEIEDEEAPPIARKQTSDSARAPGINKPNQPTVEVVDDEDGTPTKPANLVPKNSVGYAGAPGDKHYKCFHGNHQIITISKAANSNVGKLIRHLKNNFPVMYRLYCALHTQTQEQVRFAQGTVLLDGAAAKEYLGKVEMATSNILKGLEQQARKAHANVFYTCTRCSSLILRSPLTSTDQSTPNIPSPRRTRAAFPFLNNAHA